MHVSCALKIANMILATATSSPSHEISAACAYGQTADTINLVCTNGHVKASNKIKDQLRSLGSN